MGFKRPGRIELHIHVLSNAMATKLNLTFTLTVSNGFMSKKTKKPKCRIPDDCIDSKRYPLFMARAVLKELIKSFQTTRGVTPC